MLIKDIIEARERYRGVVEPGSRPNFGQTIVLQKPIRAYHATHEALGKVLTNREIKTYDSIGTYFTSDPEMGSTMYGPNVSAYMIPRGQYLIARRNQDFWELVFNCLPLIKQHIGKEAADHLSKYPWSGANLAWMKQVREEAKALMVQHGEPIGSNPSDALIGQIFRYTDPQKAARYKALKKSNEYYRKIVTNPNYLKEYRALLEGAGIHGIIWNNRHWDNSPRSASIFLIFHQEDLHPVR